MYFPELAVPPAQLLPSCRLSWSEAGSRLTAQDKCSVTGCERQGTGNVAQFTSLLPLPPLTVSCDKLAVAPDSSYYLKVVVLSLGGHTSADTATGQKTREGV